MADPRVLDCIAYFEEIVGESTTPSTESLVLAALQLYQYEQEQEQEREDQLEKYVADFIEKMPPGGLQGKRRRR